MVETPFPTTESAIDQTTMSPRLVATLGAMFIAGAGATMAFDAWGQIISPALGWATLSPHGLAQSLLGNLGLPNSNFAGYFVHFYLVGLLAYPLGWLVIFRPVWTAVTGDRPPWVVPALIYGFGLWGVAIGGVTVLAGLPAFLNFTGITWVALIGHVLYGVVMVAILRLIGADR
ncbi:MAG: hypothetical protein AAGF79_21795 [Pseudomonadota bacterium]